LSRKTMEGNQRKVLVCFLVVLALWLFPKEVIAFSVQPRGGGGVVKSDQFDDSYYSQGGLDIFFYEGKYVHFFLGGESSSYTAESPFSYGAIGYSVDILAASFGLRFNVNTKGRWKPYLSLRGVAGTVEYKVTETKYSQEGCGFSGDPLLSSDFMTYSAGLGIDIGISKRFGLGIEANYTGGLPTFKVDCDNEHNYEEEIHPGDYMVGLNLALRYHF